MTVLDRYRTGWTAGTWFRTLKTGTRIRDRRPAGAGGLRGCLASGAVTAVRADGLTVPARERPGIPAAEALPQEDIGLLRTLLEAQGHREAGRTPGGKPPGIRAAVIDLGASSEPPLETPAAPRNGKGLAGTRAAQLGRPGARRARREKAGIEPHI